MPSRSDFSSPLYLHPFDHPRMLLVSIPFDGSGFGGCSRAMKIALSAKNKLCFITAESGRPDATHPSFVV